MSSTYIEEWSRQIQEEIQEETADWSRELQEEPKGKYHSRAPGRDHGDTIWSKYLLGKTLFQQQQYDKAEKLLREVVDGQNSTLGRNHEDTLLSNYWLGITHYKQQKYNEAEGCLRQNTDRCEANFRKDSRETLRSKFWLARTLYEQQKYYEAEELFRQVLDGQEKTLGIEHEKTLRTRRWTQKSQRRISRISTTGYSDSTDPANRLDAFFLDRQHNQKPYSDAEITQISMALKHVCPQWSKVPRTYIVLRSIDHLNSIDSLIKIGFSDYWFPVTAQLLPACLQPSVRAAFACAQNLILTKSIDLEKGEEGQHCYFESGEVPPFESQRKLGKGGFGEVDEALSQISHKKYARKLVLRSKIFKGPRKESTNQLIAEIETLKRLKHHHIVEFVGSYTDTKHIALIMSPVADMDLHTYLKRSTAALYRELRTFFGCLATGLEFLHKQKVRHKDIKPHNILIHRGKILLTDFGLSFDFTDAGRSTTTGMVNGFTRKYCSPEVAQFAERNTYSDIWSLGVVFLEMLTVLKGKSIEDMEAFLRDYGSRQPFVHANLDALPDFITELRARGQSSDNRALGWTEQMLQVKPQSRPTASELVSTIRNSGSGKEKMQFIQECCVDEYSSDEDV